MASESPAPPIGSILEVVTPIGSNRYAEVTPTGLVDVDRIALGDLSDCRSWRYATDEERVEWDAHRLEMAVVRRPRSFPPGAGLVAHISTRCI